MQDTSGSLDVGLVLLSSDFRVVGMNPYARKILGSTISELGQTVFAYHNKSFHSTIDLLLKRCCSNGAFTPVAMIIDVTEQTGAKRHPRIRQTQIDKFPVPLTVRTKNFLFAFPLVFADVAGSQSKMIRTMSVRRFLSPLQ